jgi:hypothetical protein
MMALKILDVLTTSEKKIKEGTVDCGTCPVSMACAISAGGNGWKFGCCGSTAVEVGVDGALLYIMDCSNNHFEQNNKTPAMRCPLCTGDIIEWAERGNAEKYRYVRTVHSTVPVKTRLDLWRKRLLIAQEKIRKETSRLKGA